MLWWLFWFLVGGLVVGAIARLLVPGEERLGCGGTILLGIVGSFVGGFLGNLIGPGSIFHVERAGIIGSIIGAVVALLVWRAVEKTSRRGPPAGGSGA